MNLAFSAARRAVELKAQFSFKSGLSPFGTSNSITSDQNDLLFTFFENCLVSVTFSFQALEAFCNYSISRTWRKPVEVKKGKKKETLHHEAAERSISTEDKLKSILPKIYDVPTPSGNASWERFIKLKHARWADGSRAPHPEGRDDAGERVPRLCLRQGPVGWRGTGRGTNASDVASNRRNMTNRCRPMPYIVG